MHITVYRNGSTEDGKVIRDRSRSLEELLVKIRSLFQCQEYSRLFNYDGVEILNVDNVR